VARAVRQDSRFIDDDSDRETYRGLVPKAKDAGIPRREWVVWTRFPETPASSCKAGLTFSDDRRAGRQGLCAVRRREVAAIMVVRRACHHRSAPDVLYTEEYRLPNLDKEPPMRLWHVSVMLASVIGFTACGGTASMPTGATAVPTTPSSPTGTGTSAATGTWVGTAVDSSGTTMGMSTGSMGMGMPGGSMGNMTWQLTQTGSSFTGTVSFANYHGNGSMQVSGTMNGKTGTFTMTMPNGTMPMAGCSGQVTGTFDMDDMMAKMTGAYTGSTTCRGPFDHGQMAMSKQ